MEYLFFVIFAGFALLVLLQSPRKNKLGIEGTLIWMDKGKTTKPFFNNDYKVFGKPDLMYRISGGILAVEYKSRRGKIYDSDIVQAKAAALAARGSGYRVIRVLVKTSLIEQYIDLPSRNEDLFAELKALILLTRDAKKGVQMNAKPHSIKCMNCSFAGHCSKKLDQ